MATYNEWLTASDAFDSCSNRINTLECKEISKGLTRAEKKELAFLKSQYERLNAASEAAQESYFQANHKR